MFEDNVYPYYPSLVKLLMNDEWFMLFSQHIAFQLRMEITHNCQSISLSLQSFVLIHERISRQ